MTHVTNLIYFGQYCVIWQIVDEHVEEIKRTISGIIRSIADKHVEKINHGPHHTKGHEQIDIISGSFFVA